VIHGAAGLALAALSIDAAPPDLAERRRAVCRSCPEAVPCLRVIGRFCQCRVCKCVLAPKTRVASERCPLGKW
jgi:hypothetical protein